MIFLCFVKITILITQGGNMKKIFGILALSCICILLGLSVKWGRDKALSLVDPDCSIGKTENML